MATHRSYRACLRAGLMALAVTGFIGLTAGPAFAGNKPTLPPYSGQTLSGQPWKITNTGDALVTIGDSTRFTLQTTGSEMFQRISHVWHMVDPTTEQGWEASWVWPGGARYPSSDKRYMYGSVSRKQGLGAACRNWVPPSSADSAAIVKFGVNARVLVPQQYVVVQGFRGEGAWGTSGALDAVQIQRWLPSQLYVNGIQIHDQTMSFGTLPGSAPNGDGDLNWGVVRGVIDPTLLSHRAVYNLFRLNLGVDITETVHAYASGPDQDYLLYEWDLYNTGNQSRRPAPQFLTHKLPLQDFWFSPMWHGKMQTANALKGYDDLTFEWFNPWPSYTDGSGNRHTMVMFYDSDRAGAPEDWACPDFNVVWPLGMDLHAKQYTAIGWLFVETTPSSGEDDLTAPQGTNWCQERVFNLNGFSGDMKRQYDAWFCQKNADDVPRRQPEGPIQTLVNLPTAYQGWHWSTFPYNSKGRAIMVVAAGGISAQLSQPMARTMISRLQTGVTPVQTPAEIALIQTGKDSVKRTVDRAFWNIYGYDPNPPGGVKRWEDKPAAYKMAMNVPDGPRPPACAWMVSGDGAVNLTWTPVADADKKDPDTGVNDFGGYRVYRAKGNPDSAYSLVYQGTASSYIDRDVSKDFVYYYKLMSIDDGTQNWSNPGVKLESGPFWIWNGWYAQGVRPSGKTAITSAGLDSIRVVPNPYNVRLEFPSGAPTTSIVWKNIPGICTIRIYTTAGDLVHTIEHTIGGSEPWDMRTSNNQYIATGVYIYTIDSEIGSHVGKFVVIR